MVSYRPRVTLLDALFSFWFGTGIKERGVQEAEGGKRERERQRASEREGDRRMEMDR